MRKWGPGGHFGGSFKRRSQKIKKRVHMCMNAPYVDIYLHSLFYMNYSTETI